MPVCFACRSLKGAKRQYSVTDQEGLAAVWAVKKFKSYIMGTRFKAVTDHNVLKAHVIKLLSNISNTLIRLMFNKEFKEINTVTKYDMVIA